MNNAPHDFTRGGIAGPLIRFAIPVLAALFLQAMYGAVDLLVVGQFADKADVSAVATGAHIMMTLTNLVASLAMGATILLGQQIGEGNAERGGATIGACIALFGSMGLALTLVTVPGAGLLATLMQAPAHDLTAAYVRICGTGMLVIIAYNLIGSVFRGIGDSVTPLVTVAIACAINIAGDLLLVAVCQMGAAGAAIATVAAQAVSVAISLMLVRKKQLPFRLERQHIRFDRPLVAQVLRLGLPIALSDLLVSISFLVIQAIVNALGVVPSAGVGVAEKVCAFIMLVPSAFSQSMSAFVAQNAGAGKYDRAVRSLYCGIGLSLAVGAVMSWMSIGHGQLLAGIFSNDREVIVAAADYLKAYGIDCLLTPIFFCAIGFFNGLGRTRFVMAQGIVSAFCVRVPVSYLMSRRVPVSLFWIGMATPFSSMLQIAMCTWYFLALRRQGLLRMESEKKG
ncbi:MAG: MATE family efflux transporter [Clostridia bacterium]|nr:MATE family efflux transporter [Clostridia bacterium]